MIETLLESDAGLAAMVFVPAAIMAILALGLSARALRAKAGRAIAGFFAMLALVFVLGAGSVFAIREYALNTMIPNCEAEQSAAHQRGDMVLLDCESEGLVVALPVMSTVAAVIFAVFGAALLRGTRRRFE